MKFSILLTVLYCLWLDLSQPISGEPWTQSNQPHPQLLSVQQFSDDVILRDDVVLSRDDFDVACNASTQPLVLTDFSGWFTSPNYPFDYPDNLDCSWLIVSQEPNGTIRLDFTDLATESTLDFVIINDGDSERDPVLTRFDGVWTPPPTGFKSSGPALLIRLQSNEFAGAKGFNVTYTSTVLDLSPDPCYLITRPLHLNEFNGTIQTQYFPNYYLNDANCQWLIETQAPYGAVRIDFLEFFTEEGYDTVYVLDGNDTSATMIDFISGEKTQDNLPGPYLSTGRYLAVVFRSDVTVVRAGIHAAFTTVLPTKCGTILHEAPDDAIVGVGYDVICYVDVDDFQFRDTQCSDLVKNFDGIGNAQDLVAQGGNFGCLLSARDDFVGSQAACYDNYQWQSKLSNCASCNKLIVCIRFG